MTLPIGPTWALAHIIIKMPLLGVAVIGGFLLAADSNQNRPMVAITFDDGYQSVLDIAVPAMAERGMVGTHYITISYYDENIMDLSDIPIFIENGWEVGAHTLTHRDLTVLDDDNLIQELVEPKAILEGFSGVEVTSFSSPFGYYDERTLEVISQYYQSHVNAWSQNIGMNKVDDFDPMLIHRVDFYNISTEELCETVSNMNSGQMYTIIFHNISTPEERDRSVWIYDTTPEDFRAVLDCISDSGVDVVTVSEAVARMTEMASQ